MAARTRFSARMNETPCGAFYWAAAGGGAGLRESPPGRRIFRFAARMVASPRASPASVTSLGEPCGAAAAAMPSRPLLAPFSRRKISRPRPQATNLL